MARNWEKGYYSCSAAIKKKYRFLELWRWIRIVSYAARSTPIRGFPQKQYTVTGSHSKQYTATGFPRGAVHCKGISHSRQYTVTGFPTGAVHYDGTSHSKQYSVTGFPKGAVHCHGISHSKQYTVTGFPTESGSDNQEKNIRTQTHIKCWCRKKCLKQYKILFQSTRTQRVLKKNFRSVTAVDLNKYHHSTRAHIFLSYYLI